MPVPVKARGVFLFNIFRHISPPRRGCGDLIFEFINMFPSIPMNSWGVKSDTPTLSFFYSATSVTRITFLRSKVYLFDTFFEPYPSTCQRLLPQNRFIFYNKRVPEA